jgi:hypothetical protein
MGLTRMTIVINRLIKHWADQNIPIVPKSIEVIEAIDKDKSLFMSDDFKKFYSCVNGMEAFYPNEIDEEGFLFYPVEAIISVADEFNNSNLMNDGDNVFIFAEYMHKSWWYGFKSMDKGGYIIGIIPDNQNFKPITNSLIDFLELYLENSSKLYSYYDS